MEEVAVSSKQIVDWLSMITLIMFIGSLFFEVWKFSVISLMLSMICLISSQRFLIDAKEEKK